MNIRGLAFLFVGVFMAGHFTGKLFAQEPADGTAPKVYYIRSVDFEVEGRTRPFALLQKGEFKAGEQIAGEADLQKYIAEKTQLLMNQRVLESVHIDYTTGEAEKNAEGETLIPVDLLVRVTDTWNIIALPYPKYDNNTGFEFIIKARDYNFLGTMNALRLDLGFKRNREDENSYLLEVDSDTPFQAFGYIWNFNFDHAFSYTSGQPLYYKNTTGLSLELPFYWTAFNLGFNEYAIFNEENSTANRRAGYGDYFEGGYMSSELYGSWKIPTGFLVGDFGELTYTPKLSGRISYRPGGSVDYPREGLSVTGSHSLGFGRTDWIGNYRRSLEVSLDNSNGYNFYKYNWNRNISMNVVGHFPLSKFFGVSGRLRLRNWFDDPLEDAGDDLRGILNKTVQAKTMLSLSLDFPFRLIHFYPLEFLQKRSLRFFDFELHASPFVDLALVRGWNGDPGVSMETVSFRPEDVFCTGGLEVIVFPAFMRSLYLRVSLGYNLRELVKTKSLPSGDNRELFIGLGHHY